MGLIRKAMSVSTMGAVDFRSDKERTARYTRQTRNAQRATLSELRSQGREVDADEDDGDSAWNDPRLLTPPAEDAAPGFYRDPLQPDARVWRYWDGERFTKQIRIRKPR